MSRVTDDCLKMEGILLHVKWKCLKLQTPVGTGLLFDGSDTESNLLYDIHSSDLPSGPKGPASYTLPLVTQCSILKPAGLHTSKLIMVSGRLELSSAHLHIGG